LISGEKVLTALDGSEINLGIFPIENSKPSGPPVEVGLNFKA